MKGSKIAWTDDTFNIVWGCEKVSPACDNCYAEELDDRYYGKGGDTHWGKNPRKIMSDKYWREPLKWDREAAAANERRLVFCSSMADVFENNDTVEVQRQRLWLLIERTPNLRWLLLTKRPQNIRRMLPRHLHGVPNIWLGTTVENPDYLWRIDKVCEVEAPVHFVSMEPLLAETSVKSKADHFYNGWRGINWLIMGCESGDKSRPTPIDHYRRLRDETMSYGTALLLKQAPRAGKGITMGAGSSLKLNRPTAHPDTGEIVQGIIERPYLDGVQHVQFPG